MQKRTWIPPDNCRRAVRALRVRPREIHESGQDVGFIDPLLQLDDLRLKLGDLRLQIRIAGTKRDDVSRGSQEILRARLDLDLEGIHRRARAFFAVSPAGIRDGAARRV